VQRDAVHGQDAVVRLQGAVGGAAAVDHHHLPGAGPYRVLFLRQLGVEVDARPPDGVPLLDPPHGVADRRADDGQRDGVDGDGASAGRHRPSYLREPRGQVTPAAPAG
jgi:hypothetical protein